MIHPGRIESAIAPTFTAHYNFPKNSTDDTFYSTTPASTPLWQILSGAIWGAVICSILRTLLDLAPPYLIGVAIDVVVEREASLLTQLGIQNPLT